MLQSLALLTAEESRTADEAAIDTGTSGETLMENAGKAVAALVTQEYKASPVLIVCGTGNNGGDGFVVARLLREQGWTVTLSVVGDEAQIKDDAKAAKTKWTATGGTITPFSAELVTKAELVIDAMFGTGIARDIDGAAKDAIIAINAGKKLCGPLAWRDRPDFTCFQAGSEVAAIAKGVAAELGPLANTQGKVEVGPLASPKK